MDIESPSEGKVRWIVWLFAIVLCTAYALSLSFTSMAKYDDESYVMLTVKTFLDGDRLYAETFTQYGPGYYMIQQPIHGLMGLPISHDVMRLKTVFAWLLLACLGGFLVARMTRNRLAGLTAMLLAMAHLQKFGLEPAHPQEVVAVLTLIALVLLMFRNSGILFLVGVCIAFAGLSKLNVGGIAAVSALFAASWAGANANRLNRVTFIGSSVLAIGLSGGMLFAIANKCINSGQWITLFWPIAVLGAVLMLCTTAWRTSISGTTDAVTKPEAGGRGFFAIATGGIVGSVLILLWALSNGNSVEELVYGIVTQHSYMSQSFYHPLEISMGGIVFAIMSAALLLMHTLRPTGQDSPVEKFLFMLPPIALAIAMGLFAIDSWKPFVHGLSPRGSGVFLSVAGPFLMPLLVIRNPSQFRMALAMSGCLSPLMSFPVPGTQVELGTLSILLALTVITFDGAESLFADSELYQLFCNRSVIVVAAALLLTTIVFGSRWINNSPLDQPGCRWVRLDKETTDIERQMVDSIRAIDSPWLAFSTRTHSRYFFWTGKKPLTSLNPTYWTVMMTESQQERFDAAINEVESICVVKNRINPDQTEPPLLKAQKSLLSNWRQKEEVGGRQIGLKTK